MTEEIHVGDIGTVLEVTVKDGTTAVDISTATSMVYRFSKPDGTCASRDAEFVTDGSDGKIDYTFVTGDLDQSGNWKLQVIVTLPVGTWHSDIQSFVVHDNLTACAVV